MADSKLISEYDKELKALIEIGLKVVILTNGYNTSGAIIYQTEPDNGQIRFITDSSYVLTGTLIGEETDTCLYSNEPNLVEVMKEALKNKITILEKDMD